MRLLLLSSLACLLMAMLPTWSVQAQSLRPADQVAQLRADQAFDYRSAPLRLSTQRDNRIPELEAAGLSYTSLQLDRQRVAQLRADAPSTLVLELPTSARSQLVLELVKVDLFTADFKVSQSHPAAAEKVDLGTHYRGIVQGDPTSLVAISIFDREMSGRVDAAGEQLILGQRLDDRGDHLHVLYDDSSVMPAAAVCATPDDGIVLSREDLAPLSGTARDANNCVRFYLEADYSIYQQRGSTANVTSFVTGLFNQVATLYANESINTTLSELYVWTQADPFNFSSSSDMLDAFQATRTSFNGDLAGLLSFQSSGGIAYVDAICASGYAYSFSSIANTFATVPTYSWSVDVVAHEFGHLMGSPHTHACAWNGNGTAIDGCYTVEGNCANPGLPSGGGTIMSYCHLTSAGKDFTKGFGTQPGNLIRNRVYNAACLTSCGSTGGGGGGGGGTTCTDEVVSFTLRLDNYPSETTWAITTSGGSTVASGGPYSTSGATVSETFCLPAGCYNFVINDSYGDGICCDYGNGSYLLKDAANATLASGGQFGSSETKNFCVGDTGGGGGGGGGGGTGGGECTVIDWATYPVSSYGGNQDQGQADLLDGGQTLRIQNNAWKSIALNYTVTPNTVIEFEFGSTLRGEVHGIGFDNDNSLSSNRTFKLYGTQSWGISAFNNYATSAGNWKAYTIPVGQYFTGTFNRLVFAADHDGGARNGNSFYRNIRIYEGSGCGNMPPVGGGTLANLTPTASAPQLTLFPNPVQAELTVDVHTPTPGTGRLEVLNTLGQVMEVQQIDLAAGHNRYYLPTARLAAGSYWLRLRTDGEYLSKAFSVVR